MSYYIKKLIDDAVLITTYMPPFDPSKDASTALQELIAFSQQVNRPFYAITDVSLINLSFDDIVNGLAATRTTLKQVPVTFVIVGSGEMLAFGAKAIAQRQYGDHEPAKLFNSQENALAYIQQERGKV